MKFILGEKVAMSQLFKEDGQVVPVTVIKAGPCQVTQVKSKETDGYAAVQLGFGLKRRISKPTFGHLKDLPKFRYLREFRISDKDQFSRGQEVKVETFTEGDLVKVTGLVKGRGFQGVVKRHGFHGSPKTHGHKDQLRMPGSIGSTGPQRVLKGTRMAGRMGGNQVSITNMKVAAVDAENNLLYLKGAVPGARGSLLLVTSK